MARITVGLDDDLLERLMEESGASSKAEAVRTAVHEFIHRERKLELLDLKGTLNLEDNWKELRQLERDEQWCRFRRYVHLD